MAVLLVEHDIDRVFALADRVTVMNEGSVLVEGTADEARSDRAVQRGLYRHRGRARSRRRAGRRRPRGRRAADVAAT